MPVAGNVVRNDWLFLDAAGAPKAGVVAPTDLTFELVRDAGAGFGAASEAVPSTVSGTFYAVPGMPGHYNLEYTPTGPGLYVLYLNEIAVDSTGRRWHFPCEVVSAGSQYLPSFANAFCAESDVERWTQLAFDTTSKPTSAEVAGFSQARASEMRSVFAASGWTVSPSTITAGSVEQDMARECNALGAAADAWMAKFMDTEPAESAKADRFLDQYQIRLERLQAYAKAVLAESKIRTPMTSGELTLRDEGNTTDSGLRDAIRMDTRW